MTNKKDAFGWGIFITLCVLLGISTYIWIQDVDAQSYPAWYDWRYYEGEEVAEFTKESTEFYTPEWRYARSKEQVQADLCKKLKISCPEIKGSYAVPYRTYRRNPVYLSRNTQLINDKYTYYKNEDERNKAVKDNSFLYNMDRHVSNRFYAREAWRYLLSQEK